MYMIVSTVCAVCLFSLYQPFMEIWMGKEYMFDYSTVVLLIIYFYMLKMGDIRSIWVDAVGLYWEIRWRAIIEVALNLVLCYIFVRIWGINGLIGGTLTSLFLVNFLYSSSITFKYYFGNNKLISYYLTQIFHLCVMIGICAICFYLFNQFEEIAGISNLWVKMAYRLILSVMLSVIVIYVIFHRTKTYQEAKEWVTSKFSNSTNI